MQNSCRSEWRGRSAGAIDASWKSAEDGPLKLQGMLQWTCKIYPITAAFSARAGARISINPSRRNARHHLREMAKRYRLPEAA